MEITVSSQRRCVLSDRKFGNNFTWLFECFKQNLLVEFDTLINPSISRCRKLTWRDTVYRNFRENTIKFTCKHRHGILTIDIHEELTIHCCRVTFDLKIFTILEIYFSDTKFISIENLLTRDGNFQMPNLSKYGNSVI